MMKMHTGVAFLVLAMGCTGVMGEDLPNMTPNHSSSATVQVRDDVAGLSKLLHLPAGVTSVRYVVTPLGKNTVPIGPSDTRLIAWISTTENTLPPKFGTPKKPRGNASLDAMLAPQMLPEAVQKTADQDGKAFRFPVDTVYAGSKIGKRSYRVNSISHIHGQGLLVRAITM